MGQHGRALIVQLLILFSRDLASYTKGRRGYPNHPWKVKHFAEKVKIHQYVS
jgi:hypothetical protein